jgi:hypothetical protein
MPRNVQPPSLTEMEIEKAWSAGTALKMHLGKPALPGTEEVRRLAAEMRAELTGGTRQEAQQLRHALALPAMERLGLIITGIQPATDAVQRS